MRHIVLNDFLKYDMEINYAYIKNLNGFMGIHSHDFCELFLVTSGEVLHNLNGESSLLRAGNLVILNKEAVHYYEKNNNSECDFINIGFTEETFKKYANLIATPNQVSNLLHADKYQTEVDSKFLEQVKVKCDRINSFFNKDSTSNYRVISLFFDFITYVIENTETDKLNNVPNEIRKLCSELQNPDNFEKGLKEIFDKYNFSYEHYCRNFSKFIGVTPTNFFNDAKMNYARNLLIYTNYAIIDICFYCGFENLAYFYKLFFNKYSTTPSKFRLQHKRNLI